METPASMDVAVATDAYIVETRFGNWFLRTTMWKQNVLRPALADLKGLLPAQQCCDHVLDVGCGFGHSFTELVTALGSKTITGLDADPHLESRASGEARACPVPVALEIGSAAQLRWPDCSFDIVFCHQTFHHLVAQERAIAEFYRVLRPGGALLFAESTRKYIYSLPIRTLFRHPMHVQRTAAEYVAMIRQAGFGLPDERVSLPYLWWSRPDVGLLEWIGLPVPAVREETLINAVALKPRHTS